MENTNRQRLINEGSIIDFPVVKRMHNRYRKDIRLTPEQIESLKANYGIIASKMTEEEILVILRKKLKNYKFTNMMFNKLN